MTKKGTGRHVCVWYVNLMHEKKEWRATSIIRIETKILSVGYEKLMTVFVF